MATERNLVNCIADVYSKSGLRAFYRGFGLHFLLECPGRGVYMITYESCKTAIAYALDTTGRTLSDRSLTTDKTSHRVLSAAVAGIFSWLVVYPFDVVRAKLQLDFDRAVFRGGAWECVTATWRESGARGFYRGIGYTLVRAGPVAGTILPIYEATKDYIEHRQSRR